MSSFCAKCGKDITFLGSKICTTCDPDIEAILQRLVKSKTPLLCSECFEEHLKSHLPN